MVSEAKKHAAKIPAKTLSARQIAKQLGESVYNTGRKCPICLTDARYVSSGNCIACHSQTRSVSRYEENALDELRRKNRERVAASRARRKAASNLKLVCEGVGQDSADSDI